jgi:hypothetical protein
MKNDVELYFYILESLAKDAFVIKKHIETILNDHFSRKEFEDEMDVSDHDGLIHLFADSMQKSGNIKYNISNIGNKRGTYGELTSNVAITASITPEGFVFLNKHLDRKANNKIAKWQLGLSISTTVFILVTVFISGLTYWHAIKKDDSEHKINSAIAVSKTINKIKKSDVSSSVKKLQPSKP